MYTLIAVLVYFALTAALFVMRKRLGMFVSTLAFLVLSLVYLAKGFDPALPGSIVKLFGGTSVIAVLLYVTSSDSAKETFWEPIRAVMVEPGKMPMLFALMIAVPAVVAWQSYLAAVPSDVAPPLIRTVHPAPPGSIQVNSRGAPEPISVDLIKDDNPFRALQKTNPPAFAEKVARGKVVYYENCFYCHGDHLAADGHYAKAMRPRPANFQDPSVLPLFQESFFFWRIVKGGPGLPAGATPWDSVMPIWENFLSADDMWASILFLYDHTGYKPRGRDSAGEGH